MELVELRANNWRPTLSHSQYYQRKLSEVTNNGNANGAVNGAVHTNGAHKISSSSAVQKEPQLPNFNIPPPSSTSNGYFIVPANGITTSWPNQILPSYPSQALQHPSFPPMYLNASSNLLLDAPPINTKSSKIPQFREEITIRNVDSGKIMGVKGRRVAMVEEMSKTVISFQKVEPSSKERILTITGIDEQSLRTAKMLIVDTIRRNLSPDREATRQSACESEDPDSIDEGAKISIDTSADGTIKLRCADPQILQAAQSAITDYINRSQVSRRSMKFTNEEKEERKNRRKSFPMQPTDPNKMKDPDAQKSDSARKERCAEPSVDQRIEELPFIYSRAELIGLRSGCKLSAGEIMRIAETMPELLSSVTE